MTAVESGAQEEIWLLTVQGGVLPGDRKVAEHMQGGGQVAGICRPSLNGPFLGRLGWRSEKKAQISGRVGGEELGRWIGGIKCGVEDEAPDEASLTPPGQVIGQAPLTHHQLLTKA